jgi:hypothetical protein
MCKEVQKMFLCIYRKKRILAPCVILKNLVEKHAERQDIVKLCSASPILMFKAHKSHRNPSHEVE